MAASWEDVRDVLVRVGFGSPRPSSSSAREEAGGGDDGDILVTNSDDGGQTSSRAITRPNRSSASRRKRRTPGTTQITAAADTDQRTSDAARRRESEPSSVGTPSYGTPSRSAASASRSSNRKRGVRPVHQSPSQLALELSPSPPTTAGVVTADLQLASADLTLLDSLAVSPIKSSRDDNINVSHAHQLLDDDVETSLLAAQAARPRRQSSVPPSDDEGGGSDVDLHEVQQMVESITRNLEEDLREMSMSIDDQKKQGAVMSTSVIDDGDIKEQKQKERNEQQQEQHKDEDVVIEATKSMDTDADDGKTKHDTDAAGSRSPQHPRGLVAAPIDFEHHVISLPPQHLHAKISETLAAPDGGIEATSVVVESMKPDTTDNEPDRSDMDSQPTTTCCECHCHDGKIEILDQTPSPTPDPDMSDTPIVALCRTAETIKARAEVEAVLSSIVSDIELSQTLSIDLRHRAHISRLQRELASAQAALNEIHLIGRMESERRKALGDALVVELVRLSTELAKIEQFKDERNEMSKECEQMQRQLADSLDKIKKVETERDDAIAAALREKTLVEIEEMNNTSKAGSESMESKPRAKSDEDWVALKEEATSADVKKMNGGSVKDPTADGHVTRATSTDFGVFIPEDDIVEPVDTSTSSPDDDEQSQPDLAEQSPLLMLPERPLMITFSFLGAEEILAVAELSILMYSRVDSLFGLGDMSDREDEVEGTNRSERDEKHPILSPTIVAMPPPSSNADEGAGPTGPADGANMIGSALSNLLWQRRNLQREISGIGIGAKPGSSSQEEAAAGGTGNATASTTKATRDSSSSHLLTAGVASKMASKLSPKELSVIISMRTKIKELEEKLVESKERQDDLMAELRGVEGVKDFLVTKLRDSEKTKKEKEEDESRTARQVASDQEVISFLDGKVQELESSCGRLQTERDALLQEVKALRKYGHVRTGFLEDMLQLERDQIADSGKQWKAERKLLVKEVKHCRHQIAALEAESDGMKTQITKLKRVLSVQASGGASGSPIARKADNKIY